MSERKVKTAEQKKPQFIKLEAENGSHHAVRTEFIAGLYVFPESENTMVFLIESAGGMKMTVGGLTLDQANFLLWRVQMCLALPGVSLGSALPLNNEIALAKEKFPKPLIQLVDPQG